MRVLLRYWVATERNDEWVSGQVHTWVSVCHSGSFRGWSTQSDLIVTQGFAVDTDDTCGRWVVDYFEWARGGMVGWHLLLWYIINGRHRGRELHRNLNKWQGRIDQGILQCKNDQIIVEDLQASLADPFIQTHTKSHSPKDFVFGAGNMTVFTFHHQSNFLI